MSGLQIKRTENTNFGRFTEAVLDSGLRILIMEKDNYTSTYAVFGTHYGSIDTCFSTDNEHFTEVPEGIAHFLEHKLFESEEKDAFERFAATGAYANAYTSFDRTCYLFSCSDNFYENLEILIDFVGSPYFTKQTVEKEQGIIGQEIKMYEDSPNWRLLFNMLCKMYKKNPVRIDIAGTCESISKIDDKLLYECYNTFYNPANMCVCIAGNVNTEKALSIIKKNAKKSKPITVYRKSAEELGGVSDSYVEQSFEVASPLFCFGFKEEFNTPLRSQKEKLIAELMLEFICGDSSNLYASLIQKGLINDEFSSEYFYGPDYSVVFFEGESRDPKAVADAIKAEIDNIIANGIDKELFNAVKKSAWGDQVRRFESLENIASGMLEYAFYNDDMFESGEIIKGITEYDIIERLKGLKSRNSVLSVVKRKEN